MKSCTGQGLEGLQMQSSHAFSSWGQGASLSARQCVHQPGRALLARVCLFDFLCYYSCSCFSSLFPPPLRATLSPLSVSPQIIVYVHGSCISVLWLIRSPSFIQFCPPHRLSVCSMFLSSVSVLFVYCVH